MKLFQRLHLHKLFDLVEGFSIDQNLTALSFTTKAGGKVGNIADGVIVNAALEADIADGGITGRHPDAEIEVISLLEPTFAQFPCPCLHLDGHERGLFGMIVTRNRVIEENHYPVSGKTYQRSVKLEYELAHFRVVTAQHVHHFLRLGAVRESRKPAEVEKHHGYFPTVTLKEIFVFRQYGLGDLRRKVAFESVHALQFRDLLVHLVGEIP